MATLQELVDQVQDAVGALSGIRKAPDEPLDKWTVFPASICHAYSGTYTYGPSGQITGLHTLALMVVVARKDLPRDVSAAMAYAESVPNAIMSAFQSRALDADNLDVIGYTFGEMTWAGETLIGFRYEITGLKTLTNIT